MKNHYSIIERYDNQHLGNLDGYPSGKRPPGKHLRYPAAKYNNLDSDDHISLSSEDEEDEPQPVTYNIEEYHTLNLDL